MFQITSHSDSPRLFVLRTLLLNRGVERPTWPPCWAAAPFCCCRWHALPRRPSWRSRSVSGLHCPSLARLACAVRSLQRPPHAFPALFGLRLAIKSRTGFGAAAFLCCRHRPPCRRRCRRCRGVARMPPKPPAATHLTRPPSCHLPCRVHDLAEDQRPGARQPLALGPSALLHRRRPV